MLFKKIKNLILKIHNNLYYKNTLIEEKKYEDFLLEFGINNVLSYAQHGDFARCNTQRIENGFQVKNFDFIGIYPTLFDFFHLLFARNDESLFRKLICPGSILLDSEIEIVFSSLGEKSNAHELKDKYLAAFFCLKKSRFNLAKPILEKNLSKTYTKTRKITHEWGN